MKGKIELDLTLDGVEYTASFSVDYEPPKRYGAPDDLHPGHLDWECESVENEEGKEVAPAFMNNNIKEKFITGEIEDHIINYGF